MARRVDWVMKIKDHSSPASVAGIRIPANNKWIETTLVTTDYTTGLHKTPSFSNMQIDMAS